MSDDLSTPDRPVTDRSCSYWLRAGVSVIFGLLTVSIVVLWVRSYSRLDGVWFNFNSSQSIGANSCDGCIVALVAEPIPRDWLRHNMPVSEVSLESFHKLHNFSGFGFINGTPSIGIIVPHWCLLVILTSLTVFSWLTWFSPQFSLRTLLTATTLFAVLLGLVLRMTRWCHG